MKRAACLLLALCLIAMHAGALAAVPEGYAYEPWRGDKGGVIAAEISRLNDKGVADTTEITALPPNWQRHSYFTDGLTNPFAPKIRNAVEFLVPPSSGSGTTTTP